MGMVSNEFCLETPIENSYWIMPELFLAGEYPRNVDEKSSVNKLNCLYKAGIKVFIDLTGPTDRLKPYSLYPGQTRFNFFISDLSIPSSVLMKEILDTIDFHIQANIPTYLHCWGGVGRTGTVVGCWFIRQGYTAKEALSHLNTAWHQCPKSFYREIPDTKEQLNFILTYRPC